MPIVAVSALPAQPADSPAEVHGKSCGPQAPSRAAATDLRPPGVYPPQTQGLLTVERSPGTRV